MGEQRAWLRDARGDITQQEVATKAGIDRAYYAQIEAGARTPSVSVAKKIAKALRFKWTNFFNEKCSASEQVHRDGI